MKRGPKLRVVEGAEGVANLRVCSNERYNPDDLEGECAECHKPIYYRPEPPFLIRMVCLDCGIPRVLAKDAEFVMTKRTIKEIEKIMKGKDKYAKQNRTR